LQNYITDTLVLHVKYSENFWSFLAKTENISNEILRTNQLSRWKNSTFFIDVFRKRDERQWLRNRIIRLLNPQAGSWEAHRLDRRLIAVHDGPDNRVWTWRFRQSLRRRRQGDNCHRK